MHKALYSLYRYFFARPAFWKLNLFLYNCSIRGMGILNYESDYLSGESNFLRNALSIRCGKNIVFDVGANVGSYVESVKKISRDTEIHAFEPHPLTFEVLKNFTSSFEQVITVQAAVGSNSEPVELFDYEFNDGSQHASIYRKVIENIHGSKSTSHLVRSITIDEYCEINGIEFIDILKIDTEGHEFGVLLGAQKLISERRISTIQFEFNSMNVHSRTYMADFFDVLKDYDIFRLLPSGMLKFNDYDALICEIFGFQNIAAILKPRP